MLDAAGAKDAVTVLVDVRDLYVRFTGERTVYALNGVNLSVAQGEVLGLIGESGSGKSVTLRALMRLLPEHKSQLKGSIAVAGRNVLALGPKALRELRGPVVSMVFQEPMLALDPVYTIGQQIAETVVAHEGISHWAARKRAVEMLEHVRIPSARQRLDAYPHELSGGMRQRAMIALALCCRPKVLLADEPTTALDATVQIQILVLLRELQRELGMAVIFVTHNIAAAAEICDRVSVMYAGRIVETGEVSQIVKTPLHPYTGGLLACSVHKGHRKGRLQSIPGSPPRLDQIIQGCAFAPRCSHAKPACRSGEIPMVQLSDWQAARCILVSERTLPRTH
ncbi:MAG TPA: ABC transporter ATP-binding protein [Hyphomicrobiales bacterium]|nr:ABC transporter ATP-binding protein [Hyphomicrobiales bacterium]